VIVHIFVKYWLIFKLFSLAHFVDKSTLHHHVKLKLSKMSKLGLRDVIGHVTIGLGICGFLLVVHCNHASILHRYGDMGPHSYWGHDLDLLRSRDVIDHVTIGLGVGTFLLVVNEDRASILHGYGDTGLQRFWGHEFDLFGSHDVIGHMTIGLGICGFLLVVHWNHASILHD